MERYTKKQLCTHGTTLWKGIAKNISFVQSNIQYKVGEGKSILFWEDAWCDRWPLSILFSNAYQKMTTTLGRVSKFYSREGGVTI